MSNKAESRLPDGSAKAPTRAAAAAMAAACGAAPQSPADATGADPRNTSKAAAGSTPCTPNDANVGPMARTSTGLGRSPATTKPAIRAPAAPPTGLRVEMLTNFSVSVRTAGLVPIRVVGLPPVGATEAVSVPNCPDTTPLTRAFASVTTSIAPPPATVPRPASTRPPILVRTKTSPDSPTSAKAVSAEPAAPAW